MKDAPKSPVEIRELLSSVSHYVEKQASDIAELRSQRNLKPSGKIGSTIREVRIRQGLTLEELATYSNVSSVTIGKIENGNLNVRMETLLAVLSALGMKLWIG